MAKIKQITWKQMKVPTDQLADTLTFLNFQPGKFVLMPSFTGATTTIIYVESEK